MTNNKALIQCAYDCGFTESLNRLGFILGPDKFWFYRIRGDYIDLVMFWLLSNKKFMTVPVDCQKLALIPGYQEEKFPSNFIKGFGQVSGYFIDEEEICFGSWGWDVRDTCSIEKALNDILIVIENSAEPWFQSITDDQKMFNSYSLAFRESESGTKLKEKLDF
ncbi:hypothetical protein [Pseudoalteromonas sp. bablab_jr011]|uniref:hypothetical protein n=1 Tax=Pseudoalteromonas sp. bablab_jr011 TaxID=2755062 RepID=UPI0018F73879|nr:hypothetical protein [Pseudoalteromonas sp. bablab_jr011]